MVVRSFGRYLHNHLLSGSSTRFSIRSFGCALGQAYYEILSIHLPVCKIGLAWYASIAEECLNLIWIHISNIQFNYLQPVVFFEVLPCPKSDTFKQNRNLILYILISGTWSKYYCVLHDRSWAQNVGETCCILSLPYMEFSGIG
jgi:hypothetical protein